jgi:hypothetical protein
MEWISTKDRLPEAGVNVLITSGSCDPCVAFVDNGGIWHVSEEMIDSGCDGCWICEHINYWMPLPDPPNQTT